MGVGGGGGGRGITFYIYGKVRMCVPNGPIFFSSARYKRYMTSRLFFNKKYTTVPIFLVLV